MNILLTVASLDLESGGPTRTVTSLANSLAALGNRVAIMAETLPTDLIDLNIHTDVLLFSRDINSLVANFGKPDLVHDNGIWLPFHINVAKFTAKNKIPRVVSPHGMLEPWAINHHKIRKKVAWYMYQKRYLESARGLHATSDMELQHLRELGLKSHIHEIPNGVELPETSYLENLRDKENINKTVLFLSRVHPKKGLMDWIEVWSRVKPIGWNMRVIGPNEGGHREALERRVQECGLDSVWSFENSLYGDDKWSAYKNANLFVLPTHSENFGIVIAEALAAGTPVLTTTGAPWGGLVSNDCGWWCDTSVDALENSFREALNRMDDFDIMGKRGRKWVEQDFSWDGIARKMSVFYEKMMKIRSSNSL